MASPNFTINGSACPPEKAVAYGATITLALTSTSGVNTIAWSIVGTSAASLAIPTITPGGSPLGSTATFTAASDPGTGKGISYLVKCLVNGGLDTSGVTDPSLTKTALVGVANPSGIVPVAVGEKGERSATHGWTEAVNTALANIGTPGPAGAGAPPPNDLVSTSNVASLTGEQTIDGVLTSASRVLLVSQTTASQNGPWVTGSPWVRPSDFNADAEVITGQIFYVQSGTLGKGTSWQLTSGNTIAGSKTFVRVPSGAGRAPVRAVQTTALPAYTYDGSAKTITGNSNGALASTAFDGLTTIAGDRVLVVLEGTKNGIYDKTQNGDVSHPFILTRSSDLDSTGDFASGVQVDVLDGATAISNNKGTRWAMTTLGAVTLDATTTVWSQIRPTTPHYVDLSLSPYNVVGAASAAAAVVDYTAIFNQASADANAYFMANGIPVVLRVPAGWFGLLGMVQILSGVYFQGAGEGLTVFHGGSETGSPFFRISTPVAPNTAASAVDSGSGSQPIQMWNPGGSPTYQPSLHLSRAGLYIWAPASGAGFDMQLLARNESIGAASCHQISCRGRQVGGDAVRTCFVLYVQSTGVCVAQLRTMSLTNVYKQSGAGAGTITMSFTGTAAQWQGYLITVRIDSSSTFSYKLNDGHWIEEGKAIAASVALDGLLLGVTLAFTGSFTAAATYENITVHTMTTAAGKVPTGTTAAANVHYQIRFDSAVGTPQLYVSVNGTIDPSPVSSGTTRAGDHVQQLCYEETVVGASVNTYYGSNGAPDFTISNFWFGSISISNIARTASASTGLTVFNDVNQQYFAAPTAANAQLLPSGITWGWTASNVSKWGVRKPGWLVYDTSGKTTSFADQCGLLDCGFDPSTGNRRIGLSIFTFKHIQVKNISLGKCFMGASVYGPGFFSEFGNLKSAGEQHGLLFSNCDVAHSGTFVYEGDNVALWLVQAGGQFGDIFLQNGGAGQFFPQPAQILGLSCSGVIHRLIVDDESRTYPCGADVMVSVATNNTLDLKMVTLSPQADYPAVLASSDISSFGRLKLEGVIAGGGTRTSVFQIADTGVRVIECGPGVRPISGAVGFSGVPRLSNKAGFVHLYGTPYASALSLTDASTVLLPSLLSPGSTVARGGGSLVLPTGTLTAGRNYDFQSTDTTPTLSFTEGDTYTILVMPQSFTATFRDATNANATLFAVPASTVPVTVKGRFDGTNFQLVP